MTATTGSSTSTPGDGFAGNVFGQQPHVVDRALSRLILDNYDVADDRRGEPQPRRALPETWARMSDAEVQAAGIDPSLMHNAKTGFDASFYRDATGAVVLAYAGSDELQDWPHNFAQGLGFKDAQYDAAIALAQAARDSFGNNVILTGQSLGGGLAAAASLVTETPAVTFNAAGVHDRTLERYGFDADVLKQEAEQGLIRAYAVKNELLTHLQEDSIPLKWAMPDAPGYKIELPDPDPLTAFERLIPGRMLKHRIDLHFIEAVMEAQDMTQWPERTRGDQSPPATTDSLHAGPNRLLGDALTHLSPQRGPLGLSDNERFFNAAGAMAVHAHAAGLERIDHVVPATQGQHVFSIQGEAANPASRRSLIDLEQAPAIPARQSASVLREAMPLTEEMSLSPAQQARVAMG